MKLFRIATAALLFTWCLVCRADPVLPTLFSNHMILQQHADIHVWGKADPVEKIAVTIAGREGLATADAAGRWSVRLPALPAGGPFILTVQGNKKIVFTDVMIGEVWIASGQSNMTFMLSGAERGAAEVTRADYPQIRLFTVPKRISLSPQENTLPAGWQICTPDTTKIFSAVAYFFARELHRNLNVPVGIVLSSWPGTAIEEWIDPEMLRADSDLRPILEEWDRSSPAQKQFAEQGLSFGLEFDDFELIPASSNSSPTTLVNFDDGTSGNSFGGSFSYSWSDGPESAFDLVSPGRGGRGFAARVAGRLDGTQGSALIMHYRLDHSPLDMTSYAGIRFWARGNGSFRFKSLQPTIGDYDDYATPILNASFDWQPVTVWFRDLRQEGWGVVMPFTQNLLSGFAIELLTTVGYAPMPPSGLYEGMINPLLPYRYRGVIWYQGESNAEKPRQYRKLLPALVTSWRKASKNENLDFFIVQLPNYGPTPDQPGDSAWAELREAQLQTVQRVPHTGLAVTIDVGDPKNLHPPRKLPVGERLALWALGTTYAKPIVYSGPLYDSMKIMGSEIRIQFTHVGNGLEARGASLQGFAIAGADHKFRWADARIEGDVVVVTSREVADPVAVRYAWGNSPQCNLFNKDGLPASPFRTDDWPGATTAH
jgi:sialate O-acetylesterase